MLRSLEEYVARIDELVSTNLRRCRVVNVGVGAGSYLIEKLARTAVEEIRVMDPDTVDWHNLTRTAYGVQDLGQPKVHAIARRIHDACPFVNVWALPEDLCEMSEYRLEQIFGDADLIIAGTDHFPAQALLNRLSQQFEVPAVFIGIHERAEGGRIVWSEPDQTSCYRCVAGERYERYEADGLEATDLDGAHGGIWDIQTIDMVALKVCLALLERGRDSALGRFHAAMDGRNEIIVRTSPEYAFGNSMWDAVLADLPTEPKPFADEIRREVLLAHDTIWLRTAVNPECPDCGGASQEDERS